MKFHFLIPVTFLAFFISCKNTASKQKETPQKNDSSLVEKDSLPNAFDVMEELTAQFENKVKLDTFIDYLTNQKNVRVIGKLNEDWDDQRKTYIYRDSVYSLELKIDTNQATTFKDGKTIIKFSDHNITCDADTVFECVDYGFKINNSLNQPKIIEVAGHRFLYSDVYYWCNGIGCGCFLTFIYDLETKRATFLENYRIPYEGFYVSDFDNDKNPDLLVISKDVGDTIQKKGLRFDEFRVKLSWFYYDKGIFKLKKDKDSKQPCSLELYSFTPEYNHSYHHGLVYLITKNNWNK